MSAQDSTREESAVEEETLEFPGLVDVVRNEKKGDCKELCFLDGKQQVTYAYRRRGPKGADGKQLLYVPPHCELPWLLPRRHEVVMQVIRVVRLRN